MGLLDQVVGAVSEALSGNQGSNLGRATLELLQSPQIGGVRGLTNLLQEKGLGGVAASWIGTGANQPISPDQLRAALGPERIAALAQKVGLTPDQAQQALSQLLPSLVDKLTPNGQVAPNQDLMQAGMNVLKSLLG
jgi:uncharacterized protein YidB (DUF937 family)